MAVSVRWRRLLLAYVVDDGGRPATLAQMHKRGLSTAHICRRVDDTAKTADLGAASNEPATTGGGGGERWLFPTVHKTGQPSPKAMTGDAVDMMIQRRAAAAGFTLTQVDLLGGHSLRSGFVTEAFRARADAHSLPNESSRATHVFRGMLSCSSGRRVSTRPTGPPFRGGLLADRAPVGSPVTELLMGCRARFGVST